MNEKIFISYSRADKEKVFALVDKIQRETGLKCWIDLDGIESGQQFADVIMRAIERCNVVLFMMSDYSLESIYARKEINYANLLKRRIVPVLLDSKPLRGWFAFEFSITDYIVSSDKEQMNKLFRNLKSWFDVAQQERDEISKDVDNEIACDEKPMDIVPCINKKLIGFASVSTGRVVTPGKYRNATCRFYEGYAAVQRGSHWGFVDSYGIEVIPCRFDNVGVFSEGLAPAQLHGKYGYIDTSGEMVIRNTFDHAGNFYDGLALVKCGDKSVYIDCTGKVRIEVKYDQYSSFHEGLASVCRGKEWGYIDRNGNEAIPCVFEYAGYFEQGNAIVRKDGQTAVIDRTGKFVVPYIDAEFVSSIGDCYAFYCRKAIGYLYFYKTGQEIKSTRGDVSGYNEGVITVKGDKYGCVDRDDNLVIPMQYDDAHAFSDGLVAVKMNQYWGYVDRSNQVVIPFMFDDVGDFCNGYAVAVFNGREGVINRSGEVVIPFMYENITGEDEHIWWCCMDSGYYYADKFGNTVLDEELGYFYEESDDYIPMVSPDGKFGFADKFTGRQVISFVYDSARRFSEGLAAVCMGDKYGYADPEGRMWLSFDEYLLLGDFSDSLASFHDPGHDECGYVDRRGQKVIRLNGNLALGAFEEGVAVIGSDAGSYLIDKNGRKISGVYEDIGEFCDGLALVCGKKRFLCFSTDSKYGYINRAGKLVVPLKYEDASGFSEGCAAVKSNGKWGCINVHGEVVKPFLYDSMGRFSEGMAEVHMNSSYAFVDHSKICIPWKAGTVKGFSYGLACVRLRDFYTDCEQCGFINKSGVTVIPHRYDDAASFSEGLARVRLNGKWGYINLLGKLVVECIYDNANDFNGGVALVNRNGRYGYINKRGEEIVPCCHLSLTHDMSVRGVAIDEESQTVVDIFGNEMSRTFR